MDEFLQSIAKGIKERLSSAFVFNFLMAWVVFNWEFVYITLFVDEMTLKPFNRYDTLQDTNFVVWPAIYVAIGLSISSPIINSIIQLFKYFIFKIKDYLELKIDGKTPYKDERYVALKTENKNLLSKYHEAIAKVEDEKKQLELLTKIKLEKIEQAKLDNEKIENLITERNNVEYQLNAIDQKNNDLNKELDLLKNSRAIMIAQAEIDQGKILNLFSENDKAKSEITLIEQKNKDLNYQLEQYKEFGFFTNENILISYDFVIKLTNQDPRELVKKIAGLPPMGQIRINLHNKEMLILETPYHIEKFLKHESIIVLVLSTYLIKNIIVSITPLNEKYGLINIDNFENANNENMIIKRTF